MPPSLSEKCLIPRISDYCKDRFDKIDDKLDRVDLSLNGTISSPGVRMILDRHEQSFIVLRRFVWALFGASLATLGTAITTLIYLAIKGAFSHVIS